MLEFFRGFLRSTKTVVGLVGIFVLGALGSIAGHYATIRYEEVGLVAFFQEINSRRVAGRIAYPEVYFGCLAFLVFLLAMALYVRVADRRAKLPRDG